MNRTRIGTIAISMLALLLFAGGIAYVAKGIAMPWIRGEAIDLELRSAEYEYFAEGIYPHRRVAEATSGEKIKKHTVYPPYAFVMFSAFCWPDTKEAERLIFQIISVAGLILMAIYERAPSDSPVGLPCCLASLSLWLSRVTTWRFFRDSFPSSASPSS